MAGHKRAGGDELLSKSNNAKKSKQQITKATFEKWLKWARNGASDAIIAAM